MVAGNAKLVQKCKVCHRELTYYNAMCINDDCEEICATCYIWSSNIFMERKDETL